MSDLELKFLTRPGCHLCDSARPVVEWVAARCGATLVEVDVDGIDELVARYGLRIPVLLGPGDIVLAEGVIDDRRGLRRIVRGLGTG